MSDTNNGLPEPKRFPPMPSIKDPRQETTERQALRELLEAMTAKFPADSMQAQDAWSARRSNAIDAARAILALAPGLSGDELPEHTAAERKDFERECEAMGFDLQRMDCAAPEPWSQYADEATGHRWGGWLAGVEWAWAHLGIAPHQPQPEPQEAAEPVKWMQSSGGYRFFKADGSEVNPAETPLYLSAPQEASKPEACAKIAHCTTPKLCLSVGTCKGYYVMPASVRESASKEASKAVPVADEQLLMDAALAIRALVNSNERWGLTMFRKNAVAGADAVIGRIEAALASQPEPTSKGEPECERLTGHDWSMNADGSFTCVRCGLFRAKASQQQALSDEDGGVCNVCGGGLRYGERHHRCGSAVMAAVKEALAEDRDGMRYRFPIYDEIVQEMNAAMQELRSQTAPKADSSEPRADAQWSQECMEEQRARFRQEAADREAMGKALAGTEPCSFCSGTGIDGEECSDGHHGGGRCSECKGSGRVATPSPASAQVGEVQVAGSTVYLLNNHADTSNRWWATVFPGRDDNDCRVTQDECDAVAHRIAAALSTAQPQADAGVGLPPIERDEAMDRTYIPIPGGWEIQTQGKGSTFRICNTKTGDRWPVVDKNIHKALEQMARDARGITKEGE